MIPTPSPARGAAANGRRTLYIRNGSRHRRPGRARRQTAETSSSSATRNEEPQPQAAITFGLSTLKPAPWRPSTKSITEPLHVRQARAVDEQADALVLEHGVAVALLVEGERVLEAGAASAAHADPQAGGLGDRRLRREELADLLGALVGESDHCFMKYSAGASLRLGACRSTPEELKQRIEAGIPGRPRRGHRRRPPLQRRGSRAGVRGPEPDRPAPARLRRVRRRGRRPHPRPLHPDQTRGQHMSESRTRCATRSRARSPRTP